MTEDYFWGLTLSKENVSEMWDPEFKADCRGEHTLLVKQALLGPDAKDEFNVVEVETAGYKTDVKHTITVLKPGTASCAALDLMFPDPPVSFKLIKGSGPVYLLGNHSVGAEELVPQEDDVVDEEVAEFVEEEEEDDEVQVVDEDFDREDSPEIHSPDDARKRKMLMQAKKYKRPKHEEEED